MNEKEIKLFNKMNQEFFIAKNHLGTCSNNGQVECVCSWASNLNDNWDRQANAILEDYCHKFQKGKALKLKTKYDNQIEVMVKEWTELAAAKVEEINPKKQDPTQVVVKGFS